jgi:hypothetical protein
VPRQRARRVHPDSVLDADRGTSAVPTVKQAQTLSQEAYQARAKEREGARELDAVVESMPGLSRQQRDRERAMPRDLTRGVPHPRMERRLPAAGEVRRPLSSRQRKARSVTKRAVADRLPDTQHRAVQALLERPQRVWSSNSTTSPEGADMGYIDARGRRELVMHPDIKRGTVKTPARGTPRPGPAPPGLTACSAARISASPLSRHRSPVGLGSVSLRESPPAVRAPDLAFTALT